MKNRTILKLAALVAAAAVSAGASATVTDLTNQYGLTASATQLGQNEYTFNYSVANLGQGYAGSQTGLDGFTVYIPDSATVVNVGAPAPYAGAPGYWSTGSSSQLELALGGSNTSQNMVAPAGYKAFTFWGMNTQSVYQLGSTANFSITLSNVSLGSNTVGLTSYFGFSSPPAGQQYVSNQYGNYTTFTTHAVSAVAAVPEPETYAMLLAGLGMMGMVARRRRQA